MAKMGRPKIVIDWEQVDKLCTFHCTGEEIASVLKISYNTLARAVKDEFDMTFEDYFIQKSAFGKMSLRRRQFSAAMEGDRSMMIWLGKNWLGQRDSVDVTTGGQQITLQIVSPSEADKT